MEDITDRGIGDVTGKMITKDDFHLGQKLYLVPSDKRDREGYVEVEKVGRKYITLQDGSRIEINDNHLSRRFYEYSNFGVVGKFYLSQDEYLEYLEVEKLINTLPDKICQFAKNPKSLCVLREIDKLLDVSNKTEKKDITN